MKKITLVVVSILVLGFLGIAWARYQKDTEPQSSNFVIIEVHNTSMFKISTEIKCDHDYKTKKYKYYKILTIDGDSSLTVKVPTVMQKCQIYGQLGDWD